MNICIKHFNELTAEELYEIYKVRTKVFVVEQNCPYQEVDGIDKTAYHIWLYDDGGTPRFPNVQNKGKRSSRRRQLR